VCDVDFRLVGQVFGTFILVQIDNEMIVIDQHAAHERIYFEELLEEFKTNTVDSQLMLLPVTMTLSPSEVNTALSEKEFFAQIGFEIEDFGQNSIVVRSTPGTMEEQDIKDCVSRIISLLSSHQKDIPR
jgi:DNA mismatch repair protein MutL